MSHTILLYYKYIPIDDPEKLKQEHLEFGKKHGLTGRIIVAKEGINGTLEGTTEAAEAYEKWLTNDIRFADMWFKRSPGTGTAFPRWSVKVRPEIVSLHLGEEDFNPAEFTAPHLPAEELHEWLERGDEVVIVDMRNQYEMKVGHFDNSILPPLNNFRDLRQVVDDLQEFKNKKVVPVCTGGVRCEKASGYLLKKGFTDVYQLEGGIVTYMTKFPRGYFKGKLYVFDNRKVMSVPGGEDQEVVGRCAGCTKPCERYINCANLMCHDHIIMCEACDARGRGTCSSACAKKVARHKMLNSVRSWINRFVSKR